MLRTPCRRRILLAPAVAILTAGCHGIGSPAPAGLAYGVPDPNPATYVLSETTRFTVRAPGAEPTQATTRIDATAELDIRPDGGDYRVRVSFPTLRVEFENATQGTARSDESEIDGPVTVRLGPRGTVSVTDTPSVSDALGRVTSVEGLIRPLFVRLPGRAVDVGDRWTDTIEAVDEVAGTVSRARSVVVSTLTGDTVVDGARLLVIDTRASNRVELRGTAGGVEVEESLEGTTRGRTLWDPRRALVVDRAEEGDLEGTLSMPETGVSPIPVPVRVQRSVTLRR